MNLSPQQVVLFLPLFFGFFPLERKDTVSPKLRQLAKGSLATAGITCLLTTGAVSADTRITLVSTVYRLVVDVRGSELLAEVSPNRQRLHVKHGPVMSCRGLLACLVSSSFFSFFFSFRVQF